MTLAQFNGFLAATGKARLEQAKLDLLVTRGAAADKKGYEKVLKALGD